MDKKITELTQTNDILPDSFLVIADLKEDRNYKLNVSDLIKYVLESTKDCGSLDLPSAFDARVESVSTADISSASVDYKNGLFNFKFGLQKGPKGDKGEPGDRGEPGIGKDGKTIRTVFTFKSSKQKPEKPVGGYWDVENNVVNYPDGWTSTDNLEPPIWMSTADFDKDGIVRDWSDPVQITGEDGANGTDGVSSEFVFKLFAKEQFDLQPPYSDPKVDDYQVDGWIDHPTGVSKEFPYEYMCIRYKDDETGLWGEFSKPSLWSKYGMDGRDGDGIEYIYQTTTTDSSPNTPGKIPAVNSPTQDFQESGFIPVASTGENPWTDNPTGVNKEMMYEWVSVRKFKFEDQTWGDFSKPVLWAHYGKDGVNGEDGTGLTISGSYNSYSELDTAWKNGTLTGTNPPEMGDSYLINGDLYVFDGDDFYNAGQIRGPQGYPGADGASMYIHIKYANYLDSNGNGVFTDPDGETPGKYIGVCVDYNVSDSPLSEDYTWSLFKGNDGFGYEYIFLISTAFVAPEIPTTITPSDVAPDGWTDNPTGVDAINKYEWCCYRKSDENGNWGPWKGKKENNTKAWLFAMFAESVSVPGDPGPLIYSAGEWNGGAYRKSPNGNATPYVSYNGQYYVLVAGATTDTPGNSEDWLLMDQFSAVFTDILLAQRATVGNACFYGNYMFSKNGSGNFIDFDITSLNPYEGSGFKPAWCVNLITGEMWVGTGSSYFSSDGSGYLANGSIAWNLNGTITAYPVLGTVSIMASGNSDRTSLTVTAYCDDNYSSGSGTVQVVDSSNNVVVSGSIDFTSLYNSSIMFEALPGNEFDTDLTALLYVNSTVVATAAVVFPGLSGGSDGSNIIETINNYSILFNTFMVSGNSIWLHDSNTRTIDNGLQYFSISGNPNNIATATWLSNTGLVVNSNTPGNTAVVLPGNTVYVYTSSEDTTATISFVLAAENQYVDIPMIT